MESTVLTSGVVAALVAALVSVLTTEREIAAVHVTQERMKWRDKIRELALEVQDALGLHKADATRQKLWAKFSLLVNPHDGEDQQILNIIMTGDAGRAAEFMERIALLLKRDWERAKYETSFWRWLWKKRPMQVRHEDYALSREHDYRGVSIPIIFLLAAALVLACVYHCMHSFAYLCQVLRIG
jgi:hypothetical protein